MKPDMPGLGETGPTWKHNSCAIVNDLAYKTTCHQNATSVFPVFIIIPIIADVCPFLGGWFPVVEAGKAVEVRCS